MEPSPSPGRVQIRVEDDRTGMHPVTLERAVLDHLYYSCSKDQVSATPLDVYKAVALTTRDRLVHRWLATTRTYYAKDVKRIYYLSAEFLLGRLLEQNLIYLGQFETTREILQKYGLDLGALLRQETDPGLGNGGLGRLAACFLDSMATLELPAYGYGIRYEFGIFDQHIKDGWQVEHPDEWLRFGNPWELPRHEYTVEVGFYGRVVDTWENGRYRPTWVDTRTVLGVPYDTPCPGFGNNTVNTLRLWSARASTEFDLAVFNDGDYRRAVEEKAVSESISKVLYPKDNTPEGKELRLRQQYFFVACSIADVIRRYKKQHASFDAFPDKVALQLNDTHPAIAVAELMRVLLDKEGLDWDPAWDITVRSIAYTNHTLMVEALERWPVSTFERLLPRHLQIIYEINARFLADVEALHPDDSERLRRMSIVEEGPERQLRMAHLAAVGSHSVNGVAELHSRLVRDLLLPDFAELWPERFNNKTNGVTPRRWLRISNPALARTISQELGGDGWISHLDQLEGLTRSAESLSFLEQLRAIKRENKVVLAKLIRDTTGVTADPESLFDVQVKRIHLYKRQLLNCLQVVARYQRLKDDAGYDPVPRTVIFAGKAAPGYAQAKLHIKLINDVARVVNSDPATRDRLRVVFLPNYNVSLAERIIPAADLSEQISLAGMEASGTGNMKFAMNGALTIGTLDGANIEIRERVGAENFFLFGLDAEQVQTLNRQGYRSWDYIEKSAALRRAIDLVGSGFFCPDDPGRFQSVADALRFQDPYLVCADFDDYVRVQGEVDETFREPYDWHGRAVYNIARIGHFSSDRTIREYAAEIWGVTACPVNLE